jgi:hypothetical protein
VLPALVLVTPPRPQTAAPAQILVSVIRGYVPVFAGGQCSTHR